MLLWYSFILKQQISESIIDYSKTGLESLCGTDRFNGFDQVIPFRNILSGFSGLISILDGHLQGTEI